MPSAKLPAGPIDITAQFSPNSNIYPQIFKFLLEGVDPLLIGLDIGSLLDRVHRNQIHMAETVL